MRKYRNTEVVEAVKVNYLQGDVISDKETPKQGDLINIGHVFCTRHNVRVGDYVIFRKGVADQVMTEAAFKEAYKAKTKAK